jgi:hypothetical protein
MDRAERALLEQTARDAIAAAGDDAQLDGVLSELGWLEMLAAEPRDAISIVFEALGGSTGTATLLDDVVVTALGLEPGIDRAVLLPRFGAWAAPGRVEGARVHAEGLATARAACASEMIVVCDGLDQACAVIVRSALAEITPVRGIDPCRGYVRVRVDCGDPVRTRIPVEAWTAAVAAGRRAIAHEIAGALRAMLALARAHALERIQFGRPIASFQAVRHRLAEALVAIEALDAALTGAWDAPGPLTAALAKAVAGRSARTVAAHSQQVLAGIGFTTEHPFHRFLKRTMALEGLLGTADDIVVEVGRHLLATRTVPTLVEL